jgi:hypothetical protein
MTILPLPKITGLILQIRRNTLKKILILLFAIGMLLLPLVSQAQQNPFKKSGTRPSGKPTVIDPFSKAAMAAPAPGGGTLSLDDGTADTSVGLNSGGQIIWLNRFSPASFPITISQVNMMFDTGTTIGDSIQLVFFEDTDGDADFSDAVYKGGQTVAIQHNDNATWNEFVLSTPVVFNGPGDVLVGAVNRSGASGYEDFSASIDQSTSAGRSYIGAYSAGPVPNPPTLPADELYGTIDSFGYPGNWMIRAVWNDGSVNDVRMAGTGDFNNDGQTDILWRNYTTGANEVWLMNGTVREDIATLTAAPNLDWILAGAGDFNNDGKPDLVWHNATTGANAVWRMDGTNRSSVEFLTTTTNLNWQLQGIGDMNNNGKPDLVWRNMSTGDNAIWLMDGTTRQSVVMLPAATNLNWRIEGVGDLNGDQSPDLIWRNYANGSNAAWLMDGTSQASVVMLRSATNLSWHLGGAANFSGGSDTDLLWYNASTGDNAVWVMDDTTYVNSVFLTVAPE